MRPPFVKRHTTPESGFFRFFPPCKRRRRQQSVWCPDLISVFGCQPTWLHQTLSEVPSPLLWRLQSRVAGILCDLEMIPCPHTVLFIRLAEPLRLASECQARGRGSTRNLMRPSPRMKEPERVSNQSQGLRDQGPRRTLAFKDATREGFEHARFRLIPLVSSEAPGSPALLP